MYSPPRAIGSRSTGDMSWRPPLGAPHTPLEAGRRQRVPRACHVREMGAHAIS
ncbi:hypothetical protein C2E23DRAFT_848784 [Lenzites betulinus]|nr:hypothetical protein C2E23DRAFT_848784 [Lenzites betulinus]